MKLAFVVVCASLLIVGARLQRSSVRERAASLRIAELQDSLLFVKTERVTLVQGLENLARGPWRNAVALSGVSTATGAREMYTTDSADIVYVMEESCAACLANLPLLDSLRAEGLRVVGSSHHGSVQSLREYSARKQIRFPVLADIEGPLADLTNVFITPLTLFLDRGRITGFRVGTFQRAEVKIARRPRSNP